MTRYTLDLADVGEDRITVDGALAPGEIDFSSDELRQLGPLAWSGFAERRRSEVRFFGVLDVPVQLSCVRCLEPVRQTVHREFDLFFQQRDEQRFQDGEEVELEESDTQTAFLTGTELPLGEVLREQVLLGLPMKPLCQADCAGLCPLCGANLNHARCECRGEWIHPALAGLEDLKKRLQQGS